jgi:hypothetical protein
MNKITTWAASRTVHQVWLLISATGLAAAWQIEPYAFAYATIAALSLSVLLVGATLIVALSSRPLHYRNVMVALIGALPSLVSCLLLNSVSWA